MLKNKKLSLLIPKHQNKSSVEITQMYVSTIKHSATLDLSTSGKEYLKHIEDNSSLMHVKRSQGSYDENLLKSDLSINESINFASELLTHLAKTREITNEFDSKELEIINTIADAVKISKTKSQAGFKNKAEEILINFKTEALKVDRIITRLVEENKSLKEKLALAMLEEIDEKLRKENPSQRFIEFYSNRNPINQSLKNQCDDFGVIKCSGNIEDSGEEIAGIVNRFKESDLNDVIICLSQSISIEHKLHKKNKNDTRRVLRLKHEEALRIRENLNSVNQIIADSPTQQ